MKKRSTPEPELSDGLRRFLYTTAAMTGAAIMIVQILGAKMLAPYVGTSHFVWTAQIAVTLVALAAGYYLGGRVVNRSTRLNRLYGCILAAAVYLATTIVLVEPVAFACLKFKLAVGSLLASTFLFFVPLGLLAMVGPFLIRVLTASVDNVGLNAGRLSAISTLGSFVGTVLIGYVLIPLMPNSFTMYLVAAVLMGICAVYFMIWHKRSKSGPVTAIALGLIIGYLGIYKEAQAGYQKMEELDRRNSPFGLLQVLQDQNGPRRIYLNDYLVQNTYDILTKQSQSMFTYMLHDLAVAYTPVTTNVLCIGMGIGIVPMQFANEGARVDVAEINPDSVDIAKKHFDCDPDRFNLFIGDGRYFLTLTEQQYDAVILDAFLGDSTPSHLMSREAFAAMKAVLNTNGVLVMNCFGDFAPNRDFMVASLHKTLKAVFPSVVIHNAYNGGNVFFVASAREDLRILRPPAFGHVHGDAIEAVQTAFRRKVPTNPDSGVILTDDFNPVEFHDAGNREVIRRSLTDHMQQF